MEGSGSVVPDPTSPYADLGEVEPVNLISFAYQIASGMVSALQCVIALALFVDYIFVHIHVSGVLCTYTLCFYFKTIH